MNMGVIVQALKTVGLVAFYYCFSISLTFYNKWILTVSLLTGIRALGVLFNEHCPSFSLAPSPGLPVPALHHHDPPRSEVSHCVDCQETHSIGYGGAPPRFRLERVHEEHYTIW